MSVGMFGSLTWGNDVPCSNSTIKQSRWMTRWNSAIAIQKLLKLPVDGENLIGGMSIVGSIMELDLNRQH
jgi:hypothetical protein